MNLRIAENNFRFRLTPAELEMLLCGKSVEESICIEDHRFSYQISPGARHDHMMLEMKEVGFCLYVPMQTLADLKDLGRSKDGVSVKQGDVGISLQLDIKVRKDAA